VVVRKSLFSHVRANRFLTTLPDTSKKYLKLEDRLPFQAPAFQRPTVSKNPHSESRAARLARVQSSPELPHKTLGGDKPGFGGLSHLKSQSRTSASAKEKGLKTSKSLICMYFDSLLRDTFHSETNTPQ
jgi:hypothetical protein